MCKINSELTKDPIKIANGFDEFFSKLEMNVRKRYPMPFWNKEVSQAFICHLYISSRSTTTYLKMNKAKLWNWLNISQPHKNSTESTDQ